MFDLIAKMLNPADQSVSLRHAMYLVVVMFAVGWLTYFMRFGLNTQWIEVFGMLIALVTGAKVAGSQIAAAADTAKTAILANAAVGNKVVVVAASDVIAAANAAGQKS